MKSKVTILSIAGLLISGLVFGQASSKEENPMETYTVVEKPAIMLVGITCKTANAPDRAPVDIPKLWGQFYGEDIISQIPNKTSNEVIALYCDYEGDHTAPYSIVIGCAVSSMDDIPDGMVAKMIPKSSYAVFQAVGEYPKSLIDTWGYIWSQKELGRTYSGDFEVYGDKFTSASPQELDVYIAINPL